MLTEKSVDSFLDELASASPAPGGGSTAALAGALGAALTSMVCNLTIGRKKYRDVQAHMESVLKKSEQLRKEFISLVDEDANAFNKVMAAMNMAKESEEEKRIRAAAIQRETAAATIVPLRVMELCEEAMVFVKTAAEQGNVNSISDAGVGALMLHAACLGAYLNVQANLKSVADDAFVHETAAHAGAAFRRVDAMRGEILKLVETKTSTGISS